MIGLGLDDADKAELVARYCAEHAIKKVFVLSPAKFRLALEGPVEHIEWAEVIKYKFYYRLLQEIDGSVLVVVNECLRTQNRNDLTYNCIRHFLYQTSHQMVFQHLPLIDQPDDFMILVDFETKSRWKREKLRPDILSECRIDVRPVPLDLHALPVATDEKTRLAYAAKKRELIDSLGRKDPHTIPRNLYLMSGKAKLRHVTPGQSYIGRNNRFAIEQMKTFKEDAYEHGPHVVFELCHSFIDFADFLALSRQTRVDVLVADLKVDRWYFDRYAAWKGRIADAYAAIRQ